MDLRFVINIWLEECWTHPMKKSTVVLDLWSKWLPNLDHCVAFLFKLCHILSLRKIIMCNKVIVALLVISFKMVSNVCPEAIAHLLHCRKIDFPAFLASWLPSSKNFTPILNTCFNDVISPEKKGSLHLVEDLQYPLYKLTTDSGTDCFLSLINL